MNNRKKLTSILLVIPFILVISLYLLSLIGGSNEKENEENVNEVTDDEVYDYSKANDKDRVDKDVNKNKKDNKVDDDKKEISDKKKSGKKESENKKDSTKVEGKYKFLEDEYNSDAAYREKYGNDTMEKAYIMTNNVAELWFSRNNDMDKWDPYLTKRYKKILKEIIDELGPEVKLENLEVFATDIKVNKNDLITGALATHKDGVELLNVIFEIEDGKLLVDGIALTYSEIEAMQHQKDNVKDK